MDKPRRCLPELCSSYHRGTRDANFLDGDYFIAFNLDLKSGDKSPITVSPERAGFMKWRFKKLVRFDSAEAPDVAFAYSSCAECEADYLLSDYTAGTDENTKDDCLFRFGDFNGDGFDDLVVRCATINEAGKILDDTTTLFTIQQGRPK